MEADKKDFFNRMKWFKTVVKNGLFWHGVRNTFAKIGLDVMPYYWEIGSTNIEPPQIRDDASKYKLAVFGKDEITYAQNNILGISHKDLMSDLEDGDTCLGIKYEDTIAIYSFIKHQDFDFRGRKFEIQPTEGYVHNTYTFEDFRGKNLAPYLRYHSYKHLKIKGIKRYYSISEYFNRPTLRYKQKLNIKPQKLYLSLVLFKRWMFNFTIKAY